MTVTDLRPATAKQITLVASLLKTRVVEPTNREWIEGAMAAHALNSNTVRRTIDHLMACPRVALTDLPQAPLGMHSLNGIRYKVSKSKSAKGRRYASVLSQRLDGTWTFEYAPGAISRLSEETKMSAEEASMFGKSTGVCVNCAAHLTDPRSVAASYGPICAANNGWPWG